MAQTLLVKAQNIVDSLVAQDIVDKVGGARALYGPKLRFGPMAATKLRGEQAVTRRAVAKRRRRAVCALMGCSSRSYRRVYG